MLEIDSGIRWSGRPLAARASPLAIDKNIIVKNAAALTDRANDEQYISRSLEITFSGKRIEFPAKSKTTLIHSLRIDSSSEIQDYAHSLNGCNLKIARQE
jgi:hypothetical protein